MKKLFLIVLVLILYVSFVVYKTPKDDTEVYLTDSGQLVLKSSIQLKKNGYFVVREFIDEKPGQILEISKLLYKGDMASTSIDLSDIDLDDNGLIVVFHRDNGDGVFSSFFDKVYVSENKPLGFRLSDGKKLSLAEISSLLSSSGDHKEITSDFTITYTDDGFVPGSITIQKGQSVKFVNNSNLKMWVASDDHPAHDILPTFDQFGVSEKGEHYTYIFNKAGSWDYHDHVSPAFVGTITVTE